MIMMMIIDYHDIEKEQERRDIAIGVMITITNDYHDDRNLNDLGDDDDIADHDDDLGDDDNDDVADDNDMVAVVTTICSQA